MAKGKNQSKAAPKKKVEELREELEAKNGGELSMEDALMLEEKMVDEAVEEETQLLETAAPVPAEKKSALADFRAKLRERQAKAKAAQQPRV